MSKPRLLDLFCGAGGCTRGYQRAGFYVVGVDVNLQRDYCGDEFHRADALSFPLEGFDVIHASPPCKAHTVLRKGIAQRYPTLFDPHVDLLQPTLDRLANIETPWTVENVPTAPMPASSLLLCGSMFGLRVRRHRLFACNRPIPQPLCRHRDQGPVVGVYGAGGGDGARAQRGGGGGVKVSGAAAAEALGIDWTTHQPALSQAIPPAYTEYLGRHLLEALRGATI